MSVYRIYVEKKAPFAVEADSVLADVPFDFFKLLTIYFT